ncbi:hypothetical protein [Clostridium muellerianum]|nr:hypothetical protein [Clostridium muellerianum]
MKELVKRAKQGDKAAADCDVTYKAIRVRREALSRLRRYLNN